MAFRAQRAKFGLEGGDSGAVVFSPAGLRPLRLFASEALLFSLCLRIHLFFFFFFSRPSSHIQSTPRGAPGGLVASTQPPPVWTQQAPEDACSDVQQLRGSLSR